jgi:hypothetical protein
LFGGGNPFEEIPRMLDLYRAGRLRGLIIHDH